MPLSPSIVPLDHLDHDVYYLVLEDFGARASCARNDIALLRR